MSKKNSLEASRKVGFYLVEILAFYISTRACVGPKLFKTVLSVRTLLMTINRMSYLISMLFYWYIRVLKKNEPPMLNVNRTQRMFIISFFSTF